MNVALSSLYFGVLLLLSLLGFHRLQLVLLTRAVRSKLLKEEQAARDAAALFAERPAAELPKVTIQLPLFNESTVVGRLIEATARMDYPRDRLEIQVLDDSIDETQTIAHAHVERLRAQGHNAVYVHRTNRVGFKAGALEHGLASAEGELIAIFDADFVPQADFVRSIVAHFEDPKVAMVQTRWGHMNRDESLLTKAQALMLDGHHLVENRARFGGGYCFNFSGTGGMWRKSAIIDAGGWQHDTLTEDLDLSYRAQLRGWKFIYRPDVVTPSELPEDVSALRAQQYRWAKGTVQTALKMLGPVFRSDLTWGRKIEAFFHMTPHFAYPLIVMLSVLLFPALVLHPAADSKTMVAFDLPLLLATTGSLAAFYMEAERAQGRTRLGGLGKVPLLVALGTGLAPHFAKAVFDGLLNKAGEFVRTPKQGSDKRRYKARTEFPVLEVLLGAVSLASTIASIQGGHWFAAPFAALFTIGYGYVAVLVTLEQMARRRLVPSPTATPLPSDPPPHAEEERAVVGG